MTDRPEWLDHCGTCFHWIKAERQTPRAQRVGACPVNNETTWESGRCGSYSPNEEAQAFAAQANRRAAQETERHD